MSDQKILKNCWVEQNEAGDYRFFFLVESETWFLNLSRLNDSLTDEGETVIKEKLAAWLASQEEFPDVIDG